MGGGCSTGGCGAPLTGCVKVPCVTAAKAPFLHHTGWGQCSAVATGLWKPRKIPKAELQSADWVQMSTSRPVYVAVPNMGASTTRRYRTVAGIKHYAVRKLNPIGGGASLDPYSGSYWDVPEYIMDAKTRITAQAVFPMKYAIAYFIPSKYVVTFYEDNGTKFSLRYPAAMKIDDCDIVIAFNALATDYPVILDTQLSYHTVSAPQFTYTVDQNAVVPAPNAVLLTSSPALDARYAALTTSGEVPPTKGQTAVQRAAFSNAAQTVSDFGDDDDIEGEDFEERSQAKIGNYIDSEVKGCCTCHAIDVAKLHANIQERLDSAADDDADDNYSFIARRVNEIGALVEGSDEHEDVTVLRSESSIGSHLDNYQDQWRGTSAEAEFVYGNQYYDRKEVC